MRLQVGLHRLQKESTSSVAFSAVDLLTQCAGSFGVGGVSAAGIAQVAAVADVGLKVRFSGQVRRQRRQRRLRLRRRHLRHVHFERLQLLLYSAGRAAAVTG